MSTNHNTSRPFKIPLEGIYPDDHRTFFMPDEAGKLVPMDVAGLAAMSFISDQGTSTENRTPQTSPPHFLFRSTRACDLLLIDQHSFYPADPPLFLKVDRHGHVKHIGRPASEGLSCFFSGGCEECHERYEIMFELAEGACVELARLLPQWLTALREFKKQYNQLPPDEAQSHCLSRPLASSAPFTAEEINLLPPPWKKFYRSSQHHLLDTYIEKAEHLFINLPDKITTIANRHPSFPVSGTDGRLRPTDWLQDQARQLIGWRQVMLGGYFGLMVVQTRVAHEKSILETSERIDKIADRSDVEHLKTE
ncbi:hypothetical protein H2200_005702 [Cladophialophora chaetospira]|uniref:Uncharacterized protein n=1 Tax=Cladophialophora chaetospira TaxID=386627 RepID=A0AA39CIJ8_9EURO|nr:hypothetical protein H2200_005702 [Cladophialophora chaetospira]